METFRRQFLLETVESLEILLKDLQSGREFSNFQRREIFRSLHTVKGTAQTFGFAASSRLAHELENLLAADENFSDLLLTGIELLIKSLTEKDFQLPKEFAEKVHAVVPNETETSNGANDYSSELPSEVFSQLSNQEKNALQSAIRRGRSLFGLEIKFESANFAAELISFREILCEAGEIIATFPSANCGTDGKIGFRFLLTSSARTAQIERLGADVFFQSSRNNFSSGAPEILAQIAEHGKTIAEKLNKQIEIKTETDDVNLSAQKLKLVFDVLLHLVRNAVDHAIEREGEIKIDLRAEEKGFRLTVADNGRGIDLERIKAKAVERKLISAEETLTEREAVDLIFLPELSTASEVTEISGRGIGLDAVNDAVQKAGGRISVETRKGKGTRFEIFFNNL